MGGSKWLLHAGDTPSFSEHVTSLNMWISACTSLETSTGAFSLSINGWKYSGVAPNTVMLTATTVNTGLYSGDASDWGIVEFATWDMALNSSALDAVMSYLTTRYCISTPAPLPAAYQAGMLAWYDVSGVSLQAMQWKSRLSSSAYGTLGGTAPVLATDTANATTGNQCSMQYLSGATTSSITFPQVSFSGSTGFTMCTVSRYTDPAGGMRIFQDAVSNGACARGAALRGRRCVADGCCSRSCERSHLQPARDCLLR
jgi:hypothetical protein